MSTLVAEVKKLRESTGCSMQEALRLVNLRNMVNELETTTTVEELKQLFIQFITLREEGKI